jgi:4-aminobutyrate aminotransferase-like enzyme
MCWRPRTTNTPRAACRERGLLALTAGDNALRLAPALIVTEKEIAEGCAIIDKALESLKQ